MLASQGALLVGAALLLCSTAGTSLVIHKTYNNAKQDSQQSSPANSPEGTKDDAAGDAAGDVPAPPQYEPQGERHPPPKPQTASPTAQHPGSGHPPSAVPFSAYPYYPYVPYPNVYPAQPGFLPTIASIFQRFPFLPHFPYYHPYQVSHYYNIAPSHPAVRPQPAHHAVPVQQVQQKAQQAVQEPVQEPSREVPASPVAKLPEPNQEVPTGQTGSLRSNYPHGGYPHRGYPHGDHPNRRRPGYPHYPPGRYPYRPRGYFYEPLHPAAYYQAVHDGPPEPTVMYNAAPEPVLTPNPLSYDPLQRGVFESFLQAVLRIIGTFMVPGIGGGGDGSDDVNGTSPDGGSLYVSVRNTSGPVKVTLAVAEVPPGVHAVTDLKLSPEMVQANPAFYNALFGVPQANLNRPTAAAAGEVGTGSEQGSDVSDATLEEEDEVAEGYDSAATAEQDPPSAL